MATVGCEPSKRLNTGTPFKCEYLPVRIVARLGVQMEFTAKLIDLRKKHPSFRRSKFFHGRKVRGAGVKDVMWLNPGGTEMNDEEWGTSFVKTLGMLLPGDALDMRNWFGEAVTDETFLLLLNASHEEVNFTLPSLPGGQWKVVIDTVDERGFLEPPREHASGEVVPLAPRSVMLLSRPH